MRLYLQYQPNDTGKGKFTSKLIPELEALGVSVKTENHKCDIAMSYSYIRDTKCRLPTVLRVDGIYIDQGILRPGRDARIKDGVAFADAVIWQSDFSKNIAGHFVGLNRKRNYVIFNGDSEANYSSVVPQKSDYKRNIIISAKWQDGHDRKRVHKRFKEHCKIARDYCEIDKNVCFWIIGNNQDKYYESDRIRYLGWLSDEEIKPYLKMGDIYLYVPWYDWCPNSVVEAMTAGLHVVCNNNGGQKELVDGYGTVVNCDEEITIKSFKKQNVPKPNRDTVIDKIKEIFSGNVASKINPKINIKEIAKQYKNVFEDVLGGY